MRGSRWLVAGMLLAGLTASTAAHAWVVVPPRPGQLGVSLDGQYGSFFKTGGLGSEFGAGPGLGVRVRYRMKYDRAIGLSFESTDYKVRNNADTTFADNKATLLNSSVEFYQLFGTDGKTTRMISGGFGLTQVSKTLNDGEKKLGGDDVSDGMFIAIGAGLERFVVQSFGIDFNAHYEMIFQNGSTNQLFEVGIGLVFYAGY
jgi:hypothetical protein